MCITTHRTRKIEHPLSLSDVNSDRIFYKVALVSQYLTRHLFFCTVKRGHAQYVAAVAFGNGVFYDVNPRKVENWNRVK